MTTIDWKNLKKSADDATRPLEDDWYDVEVKKAVATVASTGSQMINIVLVVTSGPAAGRNLFNNLVLSPDSPFALSMFFRTCAALGVDPETSAPGGDMNALADALIGRSARVKTGKRTFQGIERNEIKEWSQASGAGMVPGTGALTPSGIPTPVNRTGTVGAPASVPTPPTPGAQTSSAQKPVPDGPPLPF